MLDAVALLERTEKNYTKFMQFINRDSRSVRLLEMYTDYGDELTTAPASGKKQFHACFPGGYLDHVVRVTETAVKLTKMYKEMGGTIDFSAEELVFAALHHDLGKLGVPGVPYYIDQESDWHKKQGHLYAHNQDIGFMKVPDRAVFILQKYQIPMTENEWYGIKLADGLYDEANKNYLINYTHTDPIRTNLGSILHMADYLSTQVENDTNDT